MDFRRPKLSWKEANCMSNEELVIRIKAGENTADNMLQLYNQVKTFIHTIAWRYRAYGELEDLDQEGYLALYDAIDGYDPATGNKFITYAGYWIKQRIQRYVFSCCQSVHIAEHAQRSIQQYKKLCASFWQEYDRKPTDREVSYYIGLTRQQVQQLKKDMQAVDAGSLDEYVPGLKGDGITLLDTVAADVDIEADVLDQVQREQLKAAMWNCVDQLTGNQPDIIRKRYVDNMTLDAIGQEYGVTRDRIRQQEAKAMRELRKPRNSKLLEPYLDDIRCSAMTGVGVERFRQTWTSSTEREALCRV